VSAIKRRKKWIRKPLLRINRAIRAPKVRVVLPEGKTVVMETGQAIERAKEYELDLIEVSSNANPPVCKIADVGKYKYELEKKTKESKRNQTNIIVKEIRMTPKIQEHDYQTKLSHIKRFLDHRHRVKVGIFFKGREITHQDLGMALVEKLKEDLKDSTHIQNEPKLVGRSITVVFAPISGK